MPDEPVPGGAAGLRAANAAARLLEGRDAENEVLRRDLDAERELRRQLELRVAEPILKIIGVICLIYLCVRARGGLPRWAWSTSTTS